MSSDNELLNGLVMRQQTTNDSINERLNSIDLSLNNHINELTDKVEHIKKHMDNLDKGYKSYKRMFWVVTALEVLVLLGVSPLNVLSLIKVFI